MTRFFLLLFIFFNFSFCYSQNVDEKNYLSMTDKFIENYNAGNYNIIFENFNSEMKNNLPLEKTIDFFKDLKNQLGNIEKKEFVNYNKTFGIYKLFFKDATLELNLSLDKNSQINGLYIK